MSFWEQSACAVVVGGLIALLLLGADQNLGTDFGQAIPRIKVCWDPDC